MKIGKPVNSPPNALQRQSKYIEVWNTVEALPKGEWLPVECDTEKEAHSLYGSTYAHKTLPLRAIRRGTTVYVQRRTADKKLMALELK